MSLSKRRISPKELRSLGWTPEEKPKWHFGRSYRHRDGWRISHCGHPTALWPYVLQDPSGRMILTGAAFGNPPEYGTAWPTVASAVDYVAGLSRASPAPMEAAILLKTDGLFDIIVVAPPPKDKDHE